MNCHLKPPPGVVGSQVNSPQHEFVMAQLDSLYHEKEENVKLMCGWTKDDISKPDEEVADESQAHQEIAEEDLVVESENEAEVLFSRTIAPPSVISCHLLINLLNDAMTMLRYLGMITQELLRWKWIPIEDKEHGRDLDDIKNLPYDKRKLSRKKNLGKSHKPSNHIGNQDSQDKVEKENLDKKEKNIEEKKLVLVKKENKGNKLDKETKTIGEKKDEEKLDEDKDDQKLHEKKELEKFDEFSVAEVHEDQDAKEEDPHVGEELHYLEIEELSQKLMSIDDEGKKIEPIDVGFQSTIECAKKIYSNFYKIY